MILQSEITQAVWVRVTSDQTAGSFYDDMGGRIYVGQAPQDLQAPFCIITGITQVHDNYFGGSGKDNSVSSVQVDIYTKKNNGVTNHQLSSEKLQSLIDRSTITTSNSGTVQIYIDDRGFPNEEADTLRSILQLDVMAG